MEEQKFYVHADDGEITLLDDPVGACGEIIKDVDGFYYWWPESHGCYPDWVLIKIGEKLEVLNKPWNDYITEYLDATKFLSSLDEEYNPDMREPF